MDDKERLYSRTVFNADTGCLLWTGPTEQFGYGRMNYGGRLGYVHRLAWELMVGPIPEGLVLDHLCRVPNCVRIQHLEPVTPAENTARSNRAVPRTAAGRRNAAKTHCPQGHPYDEQNTRISRATSHRHTIHRSCRTCKNERDRQRRRERKLQSVLVA